MNEDVVLKWKPLDSDGSHTKQPCASHPSNSEVPKYAIALSFMEQARDPGRRLLRERLQINGLTYQAPGCPSGSTRKMSLSRLRQCSRKTPLKFAWRTRRFRGIFLGPRSGHLISLENQGFHLKRRRGDPIKHEITAYQYRRHKIPLAENCP